MEREAFGAGFDVAQTLKEWVHGLRIMHRAYACAAARLDSHGRWLAVGSLVISTIVGTAIFASVSSSPAIGWKIGTGLLSVLAAVLSALMGFLRYAERAETYRQAARDFGILRRRLELMLATGNRSMQEMERISADWSELQFTAPSVSMSEYRRAERFVGREARHWP